MTIKFRGKTDDGKYIFSNSIDFEVDGKGWEFCRLKDEFGNWIFVDNIAQLVGYDADDNEIYEDDELIDKDRHEWTAVLLPQAEMDCGGVYEGLYGKEKFKLKERGENENLS